MTTVKKFSLLYRTMAGNLWLYGFAILSIIISTMCAFFGPLLLKITIDTVIGGQEPTIFTNIVRQGIALMHECPLVGKIIWCSLIMVGFALLRGAFQYLSGRCSAIASEATTQRLRNRLYDHIQRLPFEELAAVQTGDLLQRCSSDVETVRKFIAIQFIEIGRCICMVAIAIPIMVSLHATLAALSAIAIPLLIGFSIFFFMRIQTVFQKVDECEAEMSTVLQENLSGVRVVKAFGNQRFEIKKFEQKNNLYRSELFKLIRLLSVFWGVTDGISMTQIGVILVCSIFFAYNGGLSIGTLLVFLVYEGMLLWPLRQMGRILTDMGKALVSLGRIQEILDKPVEKDDSSMLTPEIKGHIEFRNVSFQYRGGEKVLHNISFEIKPGMSVAILGKTGCGKSTLVHLLQRLYDCSSGSILIDGVELKRINKSWLRKQVAIVLQEPFLYAKTIRENIGSAGDGCSVDDIEYAATVACIDSDIKAFQHHYDTMVGEKGVTLSGGQKQRVAIARAIARKCPVLIFDDSLSAVDTETDALIRQALKTRMNQVTTIIIAHRITTLAQADLILVMAEGRLVQAGTHESLLCEEGLYQRIWNIQSSLADELEQEFAAA
ncbi:MAG: ABC transporter ATP-binding protein [Chitinivibrionales bacterium]|nr:ABC transporter ATP-binding protein [Chitinivibrionales bacterium]